jgi:hypothetical protein
LHRFDRYVHTLCLEDGRFIVKYDAKRIADREVIACSPAS